MVSAGLCRASLWDRVVTGGVVMGLGRFDLLLGASLPGLIPLEEGSLFMGILYCESFLSEARSHCLFD